MVKLKKRNKTRSIKQEDSTDNLVRNRNNSITKDDDIDTSNYEEVEVVFSPRLLNLLNEADKMFG